LFVVVTVVVVVAALGVWLWPRDDVDATTSDAPAATVGSDDIPFDFAKSAWTRSLPKDARVVVDSPYVIVGERTGVRVYELGTGTERWHYLDPGLTVRHLGAYFGKLTVLTATEVRLFDLDTGELGATVTVPRGERTAVPVNEYDFLVLSDGKDAYRMYSDSGAELWSRKPESCATSTRAYYGGELVLESSCPDRTVLARLNRRTGTVFESADLPNTTPPATSTPPTATLLPQDGPILVTTADHTVATADDITLTPGPAHPYPATAELTSVRNGWCAYTRTPAPAVTCQDGRTGAPIEQPYQLTGEPNVAIFAASGDILVGATTDTTITAGELGDHPREVLSHVVDPEVVYFGPGALVVTTKGKLAVFQ
jgi:hypothetical protein